MCMSMQLLCIRGGLFSAASMCVVIRLQSAQAVSECGRAGFIITKFFVLFPLFTAVRKK